MEPTRAALLRGALYEVLVVMARIMLRCGLSYREFAQLCKNAFAKSTDLPGGTPSSKSLQRASLLTGLSRRELRRLRDRAATQDADSAERSPAARLLHLWYTDPAYLDPLHQPKALPASGETQSFESLARAVGSDVPVGALRATLLHAGAMAEAPNGTVIPTKRYFVPGEVDERVFEGLNFGACNLMQTIEFNVGCDDQGQAHFQREIHSPEIVGERLNDVSTYLHDVLGTLSAEIDDLLVPLERDRADGDRHDSRVSLGVGLYYFDEDMPGEIK